MKKEKIKQMKHTKNNFKSKILEWKKKKYIINGKKIF